MKKITLLFFAFCCFTFTWQTSAQVLNENAGWPNAAWTITGTYNSTATAFEANPTTSQNFAFDDDDAGNGSNDNIAAESPVIDLTAAFAAGEVWLNVTSDYVYNWFNANEKLALQYYDYDNATWEDWYVFSQQDETPSPPLDNFCTGNTANFDSIILDISGFSATQLSNFRYRIYFNDNITGAAGWVYGFCFQSPTIISIEPPTDLLDYYNLQWPSAGTIGAGDEYNVYAQAYEAGLTDVTSGQAPGIEAWIGYSTADTDPSGSGWTWHAATFNGEVGNNDEYMLNIGQQIMTTGIYYYASRWRLNGGFYTYGGIQSDGSYGGVWGEDNNVSGVLTINGPANDECLGAISLTVNNDYDCAVVTSGVTTGATPSGVNETACSGTESDDVWFSFVATSTTHRISILDVVGTSTDMFHSVWTGADCGALNLVPGSCSDGDTSNRTGLTIGTTYYVRVYTYGVAANATSFNICIGTPPPPPANDECVGAVSISCGNTYVGNTSTATPENPDPGTCGTTSGSGGAVWYTFVGSNSNDANAAIGSTGDEVTLSMAGSAFDTKIRVYEGACGNLTCVGGNDDNGAGGNWSLYEFNTIVGTTYYVLVHGYLANSGAYSLSVSCVAPPEEAPECASNLTATLDATCGDGDTTLSWDAVVGADGYYVTVGTTSGGNDVLDNEDVSGTSITIEQEVSTTYYWTVAPYNAVGPAVGCTEQAYVTGDTACYCAASVNNTCCEKISNVTFADINHNSTATIGYEDHTSVIGNVNLGSQYSFTASFTGTSYADDRVIVWIDYNQDSDFDDEGEMVLTTATGLAPWTGNITISETATLGETRMRIRLYDTVLTPNGTPCGNSGFGQVEDYTLNILPALSLNEVERNHFTYYPNPVKNTLQLNAKSIIQQVSVYNMLGQEVLRTTPNNVDSTIEMSTLQTGAYFVKVTVNDRTETVRVIKQ